MGGDLGRTILARENQRAQPRRLESNRYLPNYACMVFGAERWPPRPHQRNGHLCPRKLAPARCVGALVPTIRPPWGMLYLFATDFPRRPPNADYVFIGHAQEMRCCASKPFLNAEAGTGARRALSFRVVLIYRTDIRWGVIHNLAVAASPFLMYVNPYGCIK